MNDTHLTQAERYQISLLTKAGHSEMAKLLNRHKSRSGRELSRRKGMRGYRPKQAHPLAVARASCNAPRVSPETGSFVTTKLGQWWRPEPMAGYLATNGLPSVSHEPIYRHI